LTQYKPQKAQPGAENRYGFEALAWDVLARVMKAPDNQIDSKIDDALRRIVEFLNADFGILIQPTETASGPIQSHARVIPGRAQASVPAYPDSCFWVDRLSAGGQPAVVSRIDDLPPEAAEDKSFFRAIGVETVLSLALKARDAVFGAFILAGRHAQKTWPDEILRSLVLLVDCLSCALDGKRTRLEFEDQLRFQTLLADISTKFLHLAAGQLDSEILSALRRISESFDIDRCTLWQMRADRPDTLILTHVYQRDGASPFVPEVDAAEFFPWILRKGIEGDIAVFPRLCDLPPEAARDRESFGKIGTKSFLGVPLSVGAGTNLGALTFSTTRAERDWPDRSIRQFQLLAQVLANALARKRSNDALRESEVFMDVSLDCARAGIWSVRFAPPEIWLSPKMRQLCGFAPDEEVTPDKFLGIVHPDDREMVDRMVRRAVETTEDFRMEHRVLLPDGTILWIEARGRFHPDLTGKSKRLTAISMDITERKMAEAALHVSQERFRELVEQAPMPIGIVRDYEILQVNSKYVEVFGYQNVEELRGQPIIEQWAPRSRDEIRKMVQAYETGLTRPTEFEGFGLRKDRTEFPVQAIVTVVQLPDGPATVAFLRDVTEERAIEREIQRLRDRSWHAERLARAGIITVSLAHQLNQPLSAILSNAQAGLLLLDRENPDLEEFRDILKDIVDDDRRAGDIIRTVRRILPREESNRETISLAKLIRELIAMLHSEILDQGVEVDTTRVVDCAVVADKEQIRQVLLNLITNAIEAMQIRARDQRRLQFSVARLESEARVDVRDSGPGIPERRIGKMFVDPFRTTKKNRLGIGLMICSSIVESHGGRVWLVNNPDCGLTASFTLPLK